MIFINQDDEKRILANDFNGEASIVILTNQNNEILLHLRDDIPTIIYPDYWTVPGGMKEDFETPAEAAKREVEEEIGFKTDALTLFAHTIDTHGRNELISVYQGKIDKKISELQLSEGADMQYFPFNKISELKIIPFVKKVLETYAQINSLTPPSPPTSTPPRPPGP